MPSLLLLWQSASVSAAVTGTATASITEADIVAGGKTVIITLTGDTWIAAGAASFDLQRDEILQGLDSAQSELTGWNAQVRDLEVVTAVVRTSDTVVTITLTAHALYDVTAQETITVTVPATAVNGGQAIVATPTFTVQTAQTTIVTGFDAQPAHLQRQRTERKASAFLRGDDGIQSSYRDWKYTGWPIQPPQPPHPRIEKGGSLAFGENGIEAIFIPPVIVTTVWGYDEPLNYPRRAAEKNGAILRGDDGIQSSYRDWKYTGWPIQPPQPPHPRIEKGGSLAFGENGIEAIFIPPVIVTTVWGYDEPLNYPRRAAEKNGAILRGDDGSQGTFTAWKNVGFEIQSVQPPHPRPERAGSIARGDDGSQGRFSYWINLGWPIQPVQPPSRQIAPMRSAIQAIGDGGIEARLIYWKPDGWEQIASQPPHPRPEKSGAIMLGEPGNEAKYSVFYPHGWPVQHVQPPHPRPERAGAMAPISIIDALFVNWRNAGWEVQPPQPPHPRPERIAAILRGDDGNQSEYAFWWNAGWEVQPVQPPAFVRGHKGAVMKGLDGIEARFTYILSFQDPNPRRPLYRLGGGGTYWKGRNT